MDKNLSGANIARLRRAKNWSQADLQARLRKAGLVISRSGIAKVETASRCVNDYELAALASVFGVSASALTRPQKGLRKTGGRHK